MKLTRIKDLSGDAIDAKPINYDWSGETYTEKWQYLECSRCEKCGEVLAGGGDSHQELAPESDCDGYVPTAEGPMMSYYYPLPRETDYSADNAKLLADLPLCLVEVDGNAAMALTGGGMDLTWEICEAYMLLGYIPPFHFSRPPQLAGLKLDTRHKWILAGCRCAAQVMIKRARWALRDIANIKASMKKYEVAR